MVQDRMFINQYKEKRHFLPLFFYYTIMFYEKTYILTHPTGLYH